MKKPSTTKEVVKAINADKQGIALKIVELNLMASQTGLLPYQKKIMKEMDLLVAGVKQGMHVNAIPNHVGFNQDVFDHMTGLGFRLNMETGRFYKP